MNTDLSFLNEIKDGIDTFIAYSKVDIDTENITVEHPLDNQIREKLNGIALRDTDEDFEIFRFSSQLVELWQLLIAKSIKSLRYYDTREPFIDNSAKMPIAYGVEELSDYFNKYIEFEKTLYGSSRYYRDHVVHVFRVWMLGITKLFAHDNALLKQIAIDERCKVNPIEKISIWTLIALTHDLGYPLEKSLEVMERTKEMMKSFVVNPMISMNLSFTGVQNSMNDFVLRFMSSKMLEKQVDEPDKYVARLQPKYYFKFQKSLERNKHGVLSALVIYKMLRYFLESDYSTNEDYYFKEEDVRQFYIRREILRAISSHTCHDIYQLSAKSFSILLILCDDAQEWGRKSISELYVDKTIKYEYYGLNIGLADDPIKISFSECFKNIDKCDDLESILTRFIGISFDYNEIFRDGLETSKRDFSFEKITKIESGSGNNRVTLNLTLKITKEESSKIIISLEANDPGGDNYNQIVDTVKNAINTKENPEEGHWIIELGNLK